MSEPNIESLYPMAYTNTRVPYLKIYTLGNDQRLKAVGEIPLGTVVVVTGMDLIDGIRVQKLGIGENFYIRDDEFANNDEPEVIAQDIETNVEYTTQTPYPTDDYYMGRVNTQNGAAFYGPDESLFYKSRGLSKGQKIWLRGVSTVGEHGYEMAYVKSKKTGDMEFIGYVKSSLIDVDVVATVPEEKPPVEEPKVEATPVVEEVKEEIPDQDLVSKIATMEEGPDKEATKENLLKSWLADEVVVFALHTDTKRKLDNVNQYIENKLSHEVLICETGDGAGYAYIVAAGFRTIPSYLSYTFVVVKESDLIGLKKDMVRCGLKPIVYKKD